jgi:hypothetical protein
MGRFVTRAHAVLLFFVCLTTIMVVANLWSYSIDATEGSNAHTPACAIPALEPRAAEARVALLHGGWYQRETQGTVFSDVIISWQLDSDDIQPRDPSAGGQFVKASACEWWVCVKARDAGGVGGWLVAGAGVTDTGIMTR